LKKNHTNIISAPYKKNAVHDPFNNIKLHYFAQYVCIMNCSANRVTRDSTSRTCPFPTWKIAAWL